MIHPSNSLEGVDDATRCTIAEFFFRLGIDAEGSVANAHWREERYDFYLDVAGGYTFITLRHIPHVSQIMTILDIWFGRAAPELFGAAPPRIYCSGQAVFAGVAIPNQLLDAPVLMHERRVLCRLFGAVAYD